MTYQFSSDQGVSVRKNQIVPCELRLAVTRQCDGRCIHCYNNSGKNTDLLTTRDYIRTIYEIKEVNPYFDRITLTGGEPFFKKDRVFEISEAACSMDIRVRLVTRGWELTPDVCKELKLSGVTRVQIGLDSSGGRPFGAQHQGYDTFHSFLRAEQDGFSRAVQGIRNAVAAGISVSVRYSLAKSNINDLLETYRFCSGLGVFKFKLRALFPSGKAKRRLIEELVDGNELATAQFEVIQESLKHKALVEVTQPNYYDLPSRNQLGQSFHKAYKEQCPCGTKAAYVDSNGDVKYCLFDEEVLGNIRRDSLIRIWNSEKVAKARLQRCPSVRNLCSSFKVLYSEFKDYSSFMEEYASKTKELEQTMRLKPAGAK